jgi:hypothetical protein
MAVNATNFREYPLGRHPEDWIPLYGEETFPVRSVDGDPNRSSWISMNGLSLRQVLAWEVADGESGRANQEILVQLALPGDSSLGVVGLRASGANGAENVYIVRLDAPGDLITIERYLAGVFTSLASAACAGLRGAVTWWVRFRANGTNLQAKAWLDGAAEPGAWTLSAVNAGIADGSLGIYRGSGGLGPEVYFLSYGTNGDTAPGPSTIPAGMATWALDPDAQIELTVEMESLNPDADVEENLLYSTRGRFTGQRDFPANVEMPPLLFDPGSLSIRLTEDLLFGQAEGSLGRVQLRNPRNILNFLMDRTLAGRRLTVRAGRANWRTHRWFEPIYSGLMEGEPTVEEIVDVALQSPYRQLEQNLSARRYIGIPTCIALSGAGHQAVHVAAYNLTRFLISFRFIAGTVPVGVDVGLTKSSSISADNFTLYIEAATAAVVGRASIGGNNHAIFLRSVSGTSYADGKVHLAALGVDADQLTYLVVDGEVVSQAVPPGLVDMPASALSFFGFTGEKVFDVRLYGYCPDVQEVQSILAVRASGDDPGMVGMWPCDDGLGAVATDYSTTANPITFAGTVNINYTWAPTDMGEQDQVGAQFQIAAGAVYNGPALLIDNNRQRFRVSDGALLGGLTVRTKGEVNATWTDGGDGVIAFPTLVSEPVTFDHGPEPLFGFDSFNQFPTVLEGLMQARMGLTEESYDPIATKALGTLIPYHVSFLAEGEMARTQALEDLIGGQGGHYRLDRDGRIVPGMILPPVSPGPVADEAVLEFLGTQGRSRVVWNVPGKAALAAGSFTIAFWVKSFAIDRFVDQGDALLPFPSYQAIAHNRDAGVGGYYVGFNRRDQGSIGFEVPSMTGGLLAFSPTGTVPWGTWTFVVGRYDLAASKFSIWAGLLGRKMVKVLEQTVTGVPSTAAGALELGGRFITSSALELGSLCGALSQYQVRTGALSDAGIQALQDAGGVPTFPDATVTFYAPLNDGTGPYALDVVSGTRGRVWGARWAPRMVLDFRRGLSKSKLKVKRLRPAWDAIVEWGRNYRPLDNADIAATVTATEKAKLKRLSRRHHSPAADVKRKYLDAREITAVSGLTELPDARQVSRNLRYRFDPARIQAALSEAPRAALALQTGDEIWVYHPRIRGSQGAALRVVGLSPALRSLRTALDLWGDRLPFTQAGILVDEFNPLLTDDGDPIVTD